MLAWDKKYDNLHCACSFSKQLVFDLLGPELDVAATHWKHGHWLCRIVVTHQDPLHHGYECLGCHTVSLLVKDTPLFDGHLVE